MMQTGRLFTGGVNTPHVGLRRCSYLQGRKTDLPAVRHPARADGPTAATCPTARPAGSSARPTTRSCSTPTRRKPDFQVPDLLPPG